MSPGCNGLFNIQGLLIDPARKTLLACSGDMGFSTAPRRRDAVKAFDLESGAAKASYTLPAGGYCNDLVLSDAGRIFITDSKRPHILGVGERTRHDHPLGRRSRLLPRRRFLPERHRALSESRHLCLACRRRARTDAHCGQAGWHGGAGDPHQRAQVLKNADAIRLIDTDHTAIFESNTFAQNDLLTGPVSIATLQGAHATQETPVIVPSMIILRTPRSIATQI